MFPIVQSEKYCWSSENETGEHLNDKLQMNHHIIPVWQQFNEHQICNKIKSGILKWEINTWQLYELSNTNFNFAIMIYMMK